MNWYTEQETSDQMHPKIMEKQIFHETKCAAGKIYQTKCAAGQNF